MAELIDATAVGTFTVDDGTGETLLVVKHLNQTEYLTSGSGVYQPFLHVNDSDGTSEGFNTDAANNDLPLDDAEPNSVNAIRISDLPIVVIGGVSYYEVRLDVNENNAKNDDEAKPVGISELQLYTSATPAYAADYTGDASTALGVGFNKVFDLDANGVDRTLVVSDIYSGSGKDDYIFYVPVTSVPYAPGTDPYLTLYVKFGPSPAEDAGGEEFRLAQVPSATIDKAVTNVLYDDKGTADTSDDITGGTATKAGDVIRYAITIDNTGNTPLSSVVVTDKIESYGVTSATLVSGDTNSDNILQASETWVYTVNYTVTQADIDNNGYGGGLGDGFIDNVGSFTAVFADAKPDVVLMGSDPASAPIDYNPSILVTKTFVDVTDGNDAPIAGTTDAEANGDGDIINFTITVKNDGNVTLTAPTLDDPNAVEAPVLAGAFNVGDGNMNNLFDVGETWSYTATHVLTQAEIDTNGGTPPPAQGFIVNVASASAKTAILMDQTVMDDDDASAPIVYLPSLAIQKDVASVTNGMAIKTKVDAAGDVINYTITVANTGNVSLTGVTVSDDTFSDSTPVKVSGDDTNVGVLDVGETWVYSASHTVSQGELDAGGNADGDDDDMLNDQFKNTATADSNEADPDSDDASVDTVLDPRFTLAKVITGVDGGVDKNAVATVSTADDSVNSAGDKIHYTITLANTGNVTLTAVSLTDLLDGKSADFLGGSLPAGLVLDGAIVKSIDSDGDLDVGETWTINATYTVSQKDIDTNGGEAVGPPAAKGFIDNVADATAQFRGRIDVPSVAVMTPIIYDPKLTIEKQVKDGNGTFVDADTAAGPILATGAPVDFKISIVNTGNVSLTNVAVTDTNFSSGGLLGTGTPVDLSGATRTVTSSVMGASMASLADNVLDVGETWSFTYSTPFDFGQHVNKATVDTNQTDLEFDLAYYTSAQPGPGVRTPGFWTNLGAQFYDGNATNQTKVGPNFANHELTVVDVNGDGKYVIGAGSPDKFVTYNGVVGGTKGLLIGDYNMDGITNPGEDTIFISSDQAKTILNASNKDQGDTRYVLARDVIATWLNYLSGNPIDNASPTAPFSTNPLSPKGYLDDAIDWLQKFAPDTDSNGLSTSDLKAGGAIGASTAKWQTDRSYVSTSTTASENHNVDGTGKSTDYTGAEIHNALDHYNNFGTTVDGGFHYANPENMF